MTSAGIFGIIVCGVFAFFIGRELMCWYWKVNEIVELLKELVEQKKEGK
jgi:hypothetical protein